MTADPHADLQKSPMDVRPQVQIAVTISAGDWPGAQLLESLAERAVGATLKRVPPETGPVKRGWAGELGVLFTDDAEMRLLNATWRHRDRPTNVLAFPQPQDPHLPVDSADGHPGNRHRERLLGDIALGWESVAGEAGLAERALNEHIVHLIVHGFLHILGYDHVHDRDAEQMEALERKILASLEIDDPYGIPAA